MLEGLNFFSTGDAGWCRWGKRVRELTSAAWSVGACDSTDALAPRTSGAPREARRHQPAMPSPESLDRFGK